MVLSFSTFPGKTATYPNRPQTIEMDAPQSITGELPIKYKVDKRSSIVPFYSCDHLQFKNLKGNLL